MKKKKTCTIQEATEWFAKTCPNSYAAARASGPINREDLRKAVEILKANDKKKYKVVIAPGSFAYEHLIKTGVIKP